MKIFLDIDGVMVHAAGWRVPENLKDGFPDFSIGSRVALNFLIKYNENVTVELTTSHRFRFTIDAWKKIFETRNIHIETSSRSGRGGL